MTVPQVPMTVVHKTECDGQAVPSSGLQKVLRKDVMVSLALCEYSSAQLSVYIAAHPSLLLSTTPYPHTHFRDASWLTCVKVLLSLKLRHGKGTLGGLLV